MDINDNGEITNVAVKASTGAASLDNDMIRQVKKFWRFPSRAATYRVPFGYHLSK